MTKNLYVMAACILTAWQGTGAACAQVVSASDSHPAPHLAIYDLKMLKSETASTFSAMNGRMVYEASAATCEGMKADFRMVLQAQFQGGGGYTTDFQSTSYENYDGKHYRFATKYYVNQNLQTETKGAARAETDGKIVDLEKPGRQQIAFDTKVLFPMQHMYKILDAARAGKQFRRDVIYDGGEEGTRAYKVTTLIGKAELGALHGSIDLPRSMLNMRRWPIQMSYFYRPGEQPEKESNDGKSQGGERLPFFSMSFDFFENGVTPSVVYDYGDYKLNATLKSITLSRAKDC